ncbi:hypothetical protein, partial [Cyanobacterium aponinum]|uniref:hypothetical protein n=1 Tax=Cyanobacterium aponinum TaxID=379064 RepID=UPI000C133A8E
MRELTPEDKAFISELKPKKKSKAKPSPKSKENKSDMNNQIVSDTITIDWFTALEDIKNALIYTMGLKKECDRIKWFKDFTGYEGKLKNAPTELFERVYYFLSDKITATKVYLVTKPLIEARKNNIKSDINNQIISDINKNEDFKLTNGEAKSDTQNNDIEDSYIYIENDEELKRAIAPLKDEKVLALDTETTGLDPHSDKLR